MEQIHPPRAIFFDLDDTLLDGRTALPAIALACEEFAAAVPGLDAAALLAANQAVWPVYSPPRELDWVLGRVDDATDSRGAWHLALQRCGIDDEAMAEQLRQIHHRHTLELLSLFDDALGVLTTLQAHVPLVLITNGASDLQRRKLDIGPISGYFSALDTSSELGVAKPDAAIFRHVLDSLGIEARDAWHVGDSLTTDVAGARNAGLTAVWFNRRSATRQESDAAPHLEVKSLSQLLDLLPAP